MAWPITPLGPYTIPLNFISSYLPPDTENPHWQFFFFIFLSVRVGLHGEFADWPLFCKVSFAVIFICFLLGLLVSFDIVNKSIILPLASYYDDVKFYLLFPVKGKR